MSIQPTRLATLTWLSRRRRSCFDINKGEELDVNSTAWSLAAILSHPTLEMMSLLTPAFRGEARSTLPVCSADAYTPWRRRGLYHWAGRIVHFSGQSCGGRSDVGQETAYGKTAPNAEPTVWPVRERRRPAAATQCGRYWETLSQSSLVRNFTLGLVVDRRVGDGLVRGVFLLRACLGMVYPRLSYVCVALATTPPRPLSDWSRSHRKTEHFED
jgi:hypothetical protein